MDSIRIQPTPFSMQTEIAVLLISHGFFWRHMLRLPSSTAPVEEKSILLDSSKKENFCNKLKEVDFFGIF